MRTGVVLAGHVQLRSAGCAVPGDLGPLGRVALAVLVLERPRHVLRDELADALWGEHLPPTWEVSLRGLISRLRTSLTRAGLDGPRALLAQGGGYVLQLPEEVVVDLEQAEACLDRPADLAALQAAAEVLGRPFLPAAEGVWVQMQRARLRQLWLRCLEAVAGHALDSPSAAHLAIEAAEQVVAADPLRESGWVVLMQAHASAGRRAEALRAYARCRRVLREELGVEPSAATQQAHLSLLQEHRPAPQLPLPALLRGRTPVGRGDELARLSARWQLARTGQGGLAVVSGEAGIGKTTLLGAFAAAVVADGGLVLAARAEQVAAVPHQVVADALRSLVAVCSEERVQALPPALAAALGHLLPEQPALASQRPAPGGTTGAPTANTAALVEGCVWLLTGASDRGVLLVLDDLHWAERGTLLVVRDLLRRLVDRPVLVCGCWRDDEGSAVTDEVLVGDGEAVRISLGGLSPTALAQLIATADRSVDSVALHERSAGNPFLAEQLLRSAAEDRAELLVPAGVLSVVDRRIQRLQPPARHLLQVVAAAGRSCDVPLLASAVGASAREVVDLLDDPVRRRLIEEVAPARFAFRHDLVRDAVLSVVGPTHRAVLHGELAGGVARARQGLTGRAGLSPGRGIADRRRPGVGRRCARARGRAGVERTRARAGGGAPVAGGRAGRPDRVGRAAHAAG